LPTCSLIESSDASDAVATAAAPSTAFAAAAADEAAPNGPNAFAERAATHSARSRRTSVRPAAVDAASVAVADSLGDGTYREEEALVELGSVVALSRTIKQPSCIGSAAARHMPLSPKAHAASKSEQCSRHCAAICLRRPHSAESISPK
jgi:hypothetical protein